jgi:uncharacterized protein (DUF433 family)
MDWSGCELVEVIPGKHSGDPLVVGTRIPADLVLDLVESGYPVIEILEDYPSLTAEVVSRIAAFAHARQMQHVS